MSNPNFTLTYDELLLLLKEAYRNGYATYEMTAAGLEPYDDDGYSRWVLLGMEKNKQEEEQIMDTMCQQLQMEVNASETQKYYKSKEVQDLDNPTDVVDEYLSNRSKDIYEERNGNKQNLQ